VRCPTCGTADSRVIDSRPADQGSSIRRRRECPNCGHRFTTYERAEAQIMVRKRSGRLEPFQTGKIQVGMIAALTDRPVSDDEVAAAVDEIEAEVRMMGSPVASAEIGRLVLDRLRTMDEVAYLRFASVHKDFQDATDFEREMAAMEEQVKD
jgi:transcriptional repressor NrdR